MDYLVMFADYVDKLAKQGKCYFTLKEAQKSLGKSASAIRSSINHLKIKGRLAKPIYGFYVIVPPEYQSQGCIPAEQFIPYLMEFLGCNYYAALLSAASYFGASHQAVQLYQVIIDKNWPQSINCGKVRIKFYIKKNILDSITEKKNTPKSILNVSTPEQTAFDLITYSKASGGLSHIATILEELQESIDLTKFKQIVARCSENPIKQRLGYILEQIGAYDMAEIIKADLDNRRYVKYIPLLGNNVPNTEITKNAKWKIIENTIIESDI
ncbi:hypothetical protein NOVO_08420 [Rickettsiales bacterium Ac37b]|nr:hypothetical protein NOVO_08420 [Rickettsiales bacterium Ac37b]